MAAAVTRGRFFAQESCFFGLVGLTNKSYMINYLYNFIGLMREARLSRVAFCARKGLPPKHPNHRKAGIGCWAAGEYVADCHESGALSSVRGERKSFRTASSYARPRVFHFFYGNARFYLPNMTRKAGDFDRKARFYFFIRARTPSKKRKSRLIFPHHSEIVKQT